MTKPAQLDLMTVAARLSKASRIVITTHARADGDAIAAAVGLDRVLRQQGKTVSTYLHEPVLDRYAFLTESEPLTIWQPGEAHIVLATADLIVLVDTCAAAQLEALADLIASTDTPTLAIDHHTTCDNIVDELLTDTSACACSQIITQLCDHAGWPIDAETATLLFVGLATDTGWFRFSNADSKAYVTAARLIEAGVKPNDLYDRLYMSEVEARVRLRGAVLSSFDLHADGRLAVVRLTRDAIAQCGATHQMTEELINEMQRVASVNVCIMLVEPQYEGRIRVSFRSKHSVDVAKLAADFGGGGHRRAAGAKIDGDMTRVAERVIAASIKAIKAAN